MLAKNNTTGEVTVLPVTIDVIEPKRTYIASLRMSLASVEMVLANRSEYDIAVVMHSIACRMHLDHAITIAEEHARYMASKCAHLRGKRGPNATTTSQDIRRVAESLGVKTTKPQSVELVQAGAPGTGKKR